ncbi:hypothetical protein ACLKA7_016096 [Drosophila subpalustris]
MCPASSVRPEGSPVLEKNRKKALLLLLLELKLELELKLLSIDLVHDELSNMKNETSATTMRQVQVHVAAKQKLESKLLLQLQQQQA